MLFQLSERPLAVAFGKRTTPPAGLSNAAANGGRRAVLDADTIKAHIANMIKASADIVTFLLTTYRNDKGVHAETVIGAGAALAGEFALRAAAAARRQPLPLKGWVVASDVDALIAVAPEPKMTTLLALIVDAAKDAGMPAAAAPEPLAIIARTAQAVGGSPFPPLTVERSHYPLEWSPNACPRHRATIERIARTHALDELGTAGALALAIAQIIRMTSNVLPPAISARLAAEIMIGVSRMAPMQGEY